MPSCWIWSLSRAGIEVRLERKAGDWCTEGLLIWLFKSISFNKEKALNSFGGK